jgi:phage terminase small subunit
MPTSGPTSSNDLSEKQLKFVAEYLRNGGNGAAAAVEAGYGHVGARVTASRLLRNPAVAARLAAGQERQNGRVEGIVGEEVITPERVLTEVTRIAYSDPGQALNEDGTPKKISEIPEATRRAISKIKVRVSDDGAQIVELSFWDKPKGLEMLGKRLKLFTDKVEFSGEGGEPLQILVQTYKDRESK